MADEFGAIQRTPRPGDHSGTTVGAGDHAGMPVPGADSGRGVAQTASEGKDSGEGVSGRVPRVWNAGDPEPTDVYEVRHSNSQVYRRTFVTVSYQRHAVDRFWAWQAGPSGALLSWDTLTSRLGSYTLTEVLPDEGEERGAERCYFEGCDDWITGSSDYCPTHAALYAPTPVASVDAGEANTGSAAVETGETITGGTEPLSARLVRAARDALGNDTLNAGLDCSTGEAIAAVLRELVASDSPTDRSDLVSNWYSGQFLINLADEIEESSR